MVPEDICEQLKGYGIVGYEEVALREELERHCETYTLFKLAPWPARRWKCHYRVMMGTGVYDGQTVAEVYAVALLALLRQETQASASQ